MNIDVERKGKLIESLSLVTAGSHFKRDKAMDFSTMHLYLMHCKKW